MNHQIITKKNQSLLSSFVRRTVMEALQEILADPDYGLTIKSNFIKRLKKSVQSKKAGRIISFEKILKTYQRK